MRIGFVGGGQLAMMTAQEAMRMRRESSGELNFSVNILDPTLKCPAHPFAENHVIDDFKSPGAIRRLAELSDIITYEIELGNADTLAELRDEGMKMYPSPETLGIVQDKLAQKTFLRERGIRVPNFVEVGSLEELERCGRDLGYPCMLKARVDSYDGRGNFLIERKDQLESAYRKFRNRKLMLEEFVPWEKELSIIAGRGASGELANFPVGENLHEESILRMTVSPARIPAEVSREAEVVVGMVMEAFADVGVFGIEMFLSEGRILVNEVAPRVHNTGHGTLEKGAFFTSQFEQHLRAISGLPLSRTQIMRPVVMHNILGARDSFVGGYTLSGAEEVSRLPGAHLHMYGKEEVKPRRKMGHLSIVGESDPYDAMALDRLIKRSESAIRMLKILPVSESG